MPAIHEHAIVKMEHAPQSRVVHSWYLYSDFGACELSKRKIGQAQGKYTLYFTIKAARWAHDLTGQKV